MSCAQNKFKTNKCNAMGMPLENQGLPNGSDVVQPVRVIRYLGVLLDQDL